MSNREEQKKLNLLRKEIIQLQRRLNDINNIKESWFEKSQQYKKEVSKLRETIKTAKEKRDKLTQEVREAKDIRRELNEQIKKEISHIKTLTKEETIFLKKHHIKKDPSKIKEDIEKLDFRVETEALSFNKEQEVMKVIKNLKKQFEESKSILEIQGQAKKLSVSIDNMKKEADKSHRLIQEKAKASQENHEIMIKALKQFDVFKKKEKETYKKFNENKSEFTKLNEELKIKLSELNNISSKVEGVKEKMREERREAMEKTLEEKRKEAEEKMKRGEKLKTEDLIAFQGLDEKK